MALTVTEEAIVRQLIEQQAALLSLAESESTIISKLGATKVTLADLASASAINDADLFLVRQGTTEKNVSGAIIKALASSTVSGATETAAGIVELATNAEAQTGTDNSRAVTPAALASVTATETRAGLIEIATDAEARAFTANRAIDGAKLASAFTGSNQSLTAGGYQKMPGGLILQWIKSGTVANNSSVSVTFPITFPNACLAVFLTIDYAGTATHDSYSSGNRTVTGCTVYANGAGGDPAFVLAIGY